MSDPYAFLKLDDTVELIGPFAPDKTLAIAVRSQQTLECIWPLDDQKVQAFIRTQPRRFSRKQIKRACTDQGLIVIRGYYSWVGWQGKGAPWQRPKHIIPVRHALRVIQELCVAWVAIPANGCRVKWSTLDYGDSIEFCPQLNVAIKQSAANSDTESVAQLRDLMAAALGLEVITMERRQFVS